MGWRNKVDKGLKPHLERQIKEISKFKDEILNSKDPRYLQLWYAVGNLSREIFDLNLKVKFLESALKQPISNKKIIQKKTHKSKKFLKKKR